MAKKPYTLIVGQQAAIDEQWFDKIKQLDEQTAIIGLSTELFSVLGPSPETLASWRIAYETGGYIPDMSPENIDSQAIRAAIIEAEALFKSIKTHERNLLVRRAYCQLLQEIILHNQLLLAAFEHNHPLFTALNKRIYGVPNRQVFAASCDWLREYASRSTSSSSPAVAEAARTLLRSLPDLSGKRQLITPRSSTFKRVRDLHFAAGGYFEQLIGSRQLPDFVDATTGDPIVQAAIDAIGANYRIADAHDGLWGILHHKQQVVRPPDYRIDRDEFIGIVAHEVGSHLLERLNGGRQALRLLQIGLDRYGAGNEGRAFLREQIIHHSPYDMLQKPSWEYIVLKHFAICLASGVYGDRRNFDQLYQLIYPICLFFQIQRQPDNPVYAELAARDETWYLLTRICNGTDGQGGAYYKDIVYLEGNVKIWKLARLNPKIVLYGDMGKFDITRLEHRWIVRSLARS